MTAIPVVRSIILAFLLTAALLVPGLTRADAPAPPGQSPYVEGPASRDGTGRFYLGREVGRVMSYTVAPWLDRSTRAQEQLPDRVVAEMGLAPDAVVADLGAGTGYFTFRLSEHVPRGRVYAVDVQPEMIDILRTRVRENGVANVEVVQGSETDPGLPPGRVDAVLLVDTYHELSHPFEVMTAVVQALRPGGHVYVVEYRAEDPRVPIHPLHKMTEAQIRLELTAVGLTWRETLDFLPTQHLLVFEKPR